MKQIRKRKVKPKKKPRPRQLSVSSAGIQEEREETFEDIQAEEVYNRVVAITDRNGFVATSGGSMPKRSPFKQGLKMGRGAHFAPKFKAFVENGGISANKNCVVVNIRSTTHIAMLTTFVGQSKKAPKTLCLNIPDRRRILFCCLNQAKRFARH